MAGQDLSEVDSNDVAPTGAPDELMSKPRWQRMLISFAGPAVNLIMPILLLAGFYAIMGLPYPAYLDKPLVLSGLAQTSPLAKAGVTDGDQIVSVNDVATPTWSKVNTFLLQAAPDGILRFRINRQGAQRTVEVKAADVRSVDRALGYLPVPALVGTVERGMPAGRAGLNRRASAPLGLRASLAPRFPLALERADYQGHGQHSLRPPPSLRRFAAHLAG